jgi:hypothetical protein
LTTSVNNLRAKEFAAESEKVLPLSVRTREDIGDNRCPPSPALSSRAAARLHRTLSFDQFLTF